MTQTDLKAYRFDSTHEPSDEQLGQLMENVRKTNRQSDEEFFAELRRASDEAKKRGTSHSKRL